MESMSEGEESPLGFWKSRADGIENWKKVQPLGCRTVTPRTHERTMRALAMANEARRRKGAQKRHDALAAELGWNERFPGSLPAEPVAAPAGTPEELRRHFGMVAALGLLSSAPWEN